MFFNLFCRIVSGKLFFNENSNTSRYEEREYWYMLLMVDKSASTKNKMAPRLAAGRYPSLSLSMSKAVLAPSFSFSDTFRARKKDISDYPYMTALLQEYMYCQNWSNKVYLKIDLS